MYRILVVDEDRISRKEAAVTLRGFDCRVRTVVEPNAALTVLRQVRFDAVLVSASLPDMTPSAFVDAVREDVCLSSMPVVVMAATPRTAVDAIRAGARGCIRKPVDVGAVASALPPLLKARARRPRYLTAGSQIRPETGPVFAVDRGVAQRALFRGRCGAQWP
jgi:CheY-like chemotaxis protein